MNEHRLLAEVTPLKLEVPGTVYATPDGRTPRKTRGDSWSNFTRLTERLSSC